MPSQQHEQWKQDLFDHLDRKLSGCVSCEFGESRDSHAHTHRRRHREPSQQVLWTCERMHPHSYDLLRGAGFVVMEQQQSAPIAGRCRPDLTILDTQGPSRRNSPLRPIHRVVRGSYDGPLCLVQVVQIVIQRALNAHCSAHNPQQDDQHHEQGCLICIAAET